MNHSQCWEGGRGKSAIKKSSIKKGTLKTQHVTSIQDLYGHIIIYCMPLWGNHYMSGNKVMLISVVISTWKNAIFGQRKSVNLEKEKEARDAALDRIRRCHFSAISLIWTNGSLMKWYTSNLLSDLLKTLLDYSQQITNVLSLMATEFELCRESEFDDLIDDFSP